MNSTSTLLLKSFFRVEKSVHLPVHDKSSALILTAREKYSNTLTFLHCNTLNYCIISVSVLVRTNVQGIITKLFFLQKRTNNGHTNNNGKTIGKRN